MPAAPYTFDDVSDGSAEAIASQQPVAIGPTTDFGQNFEAQWNAMLHANSTMSYDLALSDEYAKVNEAVRKAHGDVLENPIEQALSANEGEAGRQYYLDQYYEYANQRGIGVPSADEMSARARAQMRLSEANAANVSARASGTWASTGGFLGTMAGSVADPPVIASMLVGGGESATVLRTIGREALTAGATETIAQPVIQAERVQAGLPGGVTQGAENVASAAVGAGVLGGVARGVAAGVGAAYRGSTKAYQAMRDAARFAKPATAAEEDAARYTERLADLQGANPLAETPEGAQEHVERLTDAQTRLYNPETDVPETQLPDAPASPVQLPEPLAEPSEPIATRAAVGPQSAASEADTAVTATGRQVPVKYAVVEASDLIPSQTAEGAANPDYPVELQPRDRTRAVSQAQVSSIAQNLNPALLERSPTASDGAPIVAPSGVVESGNGRVLAIQRAYADNLPSARTYRAHLEKQGYPTQGMQQPVLVRVRQGEMAPAERQAFVREANQTHTLGYSATERAMSDAAALPDSALDLYRGGDVEQAQNREFVKAFMSRLPQSEHAGMIDANGALSQDAIRRIRGALLAKAYGDPDLVSGVVESADTNIKAIGGALTDAAADWAKMRAKAARGEMPDDLDTTTKLLDAVRLVQRARNEGRNVAEFVGQGDIFGGSLDPQTEAWLRLMFRNTKDWTQPVGRERFADSVRYYAQEASKAEGGKGLFGMEPSQPSDILALAKEKQHGGQSADSGNLAFDYGKGVSARRAPGEEFGSQETAATRSADFARVSGYGPAGAGLIPRRTPFSGEFPDVVVQQPHDSDIRLVKQPGYEAAKAGDARAARDVVREMLDPDAVAHLREMIGDRKPVIVFVHAEEAAGKNALPGAYAHALGKELGLPVDRDIVQANKPQRTGKDALYRLTTPVEFDGPVKRGQDYLLADDMVTQGGTLADLKGYIEARGGKVIGATSLAAARNSEEFAVRAATLYKLRQRFPGLDEAWKDTYGHDLSGLTQSEARQLLRFKSTDDIRDSVLAPEQARIAGSTGPAGGRGLEEGEGAAEAPFGVSPAAIASARAVGGRLAQQAREVAASEGAQRSLVETAQRLNLTGLPDAALDSARGPAPRPPADDPSLSQFIVSRGGIKDSDRVLANLGLSPRARPGLIKRSGATVQDVAHAATDAGYFTRRPSQQELATAIRDDLAGRKIYARNGTFGNAEARAAYDGAIASRNGLRSDLQRLGLDLDGTTNDDLRDAVHAMAADAQATPAVRTDYTGQAVRDAEQADHDLTSSATTEASTTDAALRDLRTAYEGKQELRVARKLPSGQIVIGQRGQIHAALLADEEGFGGANKIAPADYEAQMGFVTSGGEFLTRDEALKWVERNRPELIAAMDDVFKQSRRPHYPDEGLIAEPYRIALDSEPRSISRMDDPVLLDDKTGRTVTAGDLFKEIDEDEKLADEFGKCVGGE